MREGGGCAGAVACCVPVRTLLLLEGVLLGHVRHLLTGRGWACLGETHATGQTAHTRERTRRDAHARAPDRADNRELTTESVSARASLSTRSLTATVTPRRCPRSPLTPASSRAGAALTISLTRVAPPSLHTEERGRECVRAVSPAVTLDRCAHPHARHALTEW